VTHKKTNEMIEEAPTTFMTCDEFWLTDDAELIKKAYDNSEYCKAERIAK
jgi:hypothetical protein